MRKIVAVQVKNLPYEAIKNSWVLMTADEESDGKQAVLLPIEEIEQVSAILQAANDYLRE